MLNQRAKKESKPRDTGASWPPPLFHFWSLTCVLLDGIVHTVFGKPLRESLRYANVQISTAGASGDLYVWGYIPVVVAKWYVAYYISPEEFYDGIGMCSGLYLKENGTTPDL